MRPIRFLLNHLIGPQRFQCETRLRHGNYLPYETPFRRRKSADSYVRFVRELGGPLLRVRDLQSDPY